MAYSTSSPPSLLVGSFTAESGQQSIWTHYSADTGAQAQVTGFITNGAKLGMKVNDIVLHTNSATGITTTHRVVSVGTDSVDLTDATAFASGTDSD